ncbi:type 1 fimbrial protein [Acinetobacter sp. NyZ410]|uniref:fimbrial protein n=1 Tax=Acinetobacter sp. NyZ410 TaxID=2929509 RepID=UPI001FB96F13|nr:type 1 fimbrial protein [Acinetobacter sp. NyZ410]UOH17281.1 type 1 fimbrial protein [Acinetobacter sp. NyZ410]
MKKLTLPTFSTLILTLACTKVLAVDGTITVNGVITDGTCTLQAGSGGVSGVKDLTVNMPTIPKSRFTPLYPTSVGIKFSMQLTNATGNDACDAATTNAFKGIHLSAISPTDLNETYQNLLVNKAMGAGGASAKNPIFIGITTENFEYVNFSAPWGRQAKSVVSSDGRVTYYVVLISETGVVDAQNVQAKINYTLHYN